MALKENHFDSVIALILVFLVGFGLAAVFPTQEWIRTATWTVALGLALIAVGSRWTRSSSSDTDWLRFSDEEEDEGAAPHEGDPARPDASDDHPTDPDPSSPRGTHS